MAKTIGIESPVKVITSGEAPTAETLGKGEIAFGSVGGKTKLYGGNGAEVMTIAADVEAEIAAAQADIKENTTQIEALQTSYNALSERITAVETAIAALQTAVDGASSTLDTINGETI